MHWSSWSSFLTLLLASVIILDSAAPSSAQGPYPADMGRPHIPYAPDAAPECALIIPAEKTRKPMGAGLRYLSNYVPSVKRSSYYPSDGQVCITFEDVNRAIHESKQKMGNYVPQEIYELSSNLPRPPHIAVAASIVQDATSLLAEWFGLSMSTILYLLPRLDTYKTAVRDICPTFLQPVKCEMSRYRTLTGMCNNLEYPSWGSARSAMVRYLPPAYADGIGSPKLSVSGAQLPSARIVSFVVHQDISPRDVHITQALVVFGQLLDHDLTLAQLTQDSFGNVIQTCCDANVQERHPNCLPIEVPRNDPFFKFFKRTCLNFVRVLPGLKPGCPLGPRSITNTISSIIDANWMYGSTQEVSQRLRAYKGGRMKTNPMHRNIGLKDLMPSKTMDPETGCERAGRPGMFCFDAGDDRVNEQVTLTVLQTLWIREHNRIADYFAQTTTMDDETNFQETRILIVAMFQHITFNEFLPVVLGRKVMHKYGLDLVEEGYYDGYDTKVNSGIRMAFQAAAFRFGHSLLPDVTERYNKYHEKLEAIRLSQLIRQPYDIYTPGVIDTFIIGLVNQESARMDPQVTTEMTNHLFERPGEHFGTDLAALNIQRGRETGVPGYNAFREYCGLPRATSFYDLAGSFDNRTIHRFTTIYGSVNDIDLWSAGIAEYPSPGALLGPVFSCIIAEQMANIRRGDRFWYENRGWPSSLSPHQLDEIRKVKLARIFCDNSDDLDTIQLFPLLSPDPTSNPRVSCEELPRADLSKFIEGVEGNLLKKKKAAKAAAAAAAASS